MKVYILPIILFLSINVFAQSNTTSQLKQSYSDSSFTYLYGSVIRTTAKLSNSEALINIIKNVELIVYSELDFKTIAHAQQAFNDVLDSLKKEDFKQLLKINEGQPLQKMQSLFDDFSVLTFSDDNQYEKVFLTKRSAHKVMIIDIKGNINSDALTGKDITALLGLFNSLKDNNVFNLTKGNDDARNKKPN
jgi:hypothetical protein